MPADPIVPPPDSGAWRPGEALALILKPPSVGVLPIDDDYLEQTAHYRFRIDAIEAQASEFQPLEKIDRGGRRVWFFDGPTAVFMRIDVENDGTIDQTQYFGPEGLFAVVHRFAEGRRTQRIYWPPGELRVVEIRDNLPPYPGVWWRTGESPFRDSDPGKESDT